jgi:radical SAM superfamily enzyme YgiQ (UPF0313 family)
MPDDRPAVMLFHPRTEHEENYRDYWIPYSVLSLSAMLHPEVAVRILDENLERPPDHGRLERDLGRCVCVGISSMTGRQIANGLRFAQLVRKVRPGLPIVWGGAHPTLFPEEMLRSPLVDVVVIGPGELPFQALVRTLAAGGALPRVAGLAWSDGEDRFRGGKAAPRPSAEFPEFPWDLTRLDRYVRADEKIAARTLNYVSSQGCPFPCGFCSEVALHERGWNAFPADRVASDARELVDRAGITGLKFYDANFFVSVPRAMEFARLAIPLGLRWAASCHPATVLRLTAEQRAILARSGLCRLLVGLESGVQGVLDLVQKRFRVEDMPVIADRLAEFGIVGSFTFIVGFPGVPDDLEATLRMGERLRAAWPRHEVKVHFYAPYPGTPMWPDALRHGFTPPTDLEGWAAFDYYAVTTPWVDPGWQPVVRAFNQQHCPYVHV